VKKGRRKNAETGGGGDAEISAGPAESADSSRSLVLLAAIVGLLTFALYIPSLWSGFVYDAEAQILIGDYLHKHSHFADVVTLRVLAQDVLDGNRPVQLFSLMSDSFFWGKNPMGYHLMSNLLHAGNAVLLFLLMVRLSPAGREFRLAAFVATLIFAAHPVLVEPVAEVSSREDLLATCFLLVSVLLGSLWARGSAGIWALVGSWLAVLLACGSKETGVAAPFLLLLCGLLFRGKSPMTRWFVLAGGALVVAGAFLTARFTLQPEVSEIFLQKPTYLGGFFWTVCQIQPRIWAFSIHSVFWPFGLSADYVAQNVFTTISKVWMIVLILALFLVGQGLASWKSRLAMFGVAVFWLGLAPVSNFIPIYRPLADRYLYLPMAGLAIVLCGLLLLIVQRRHLFTALLWLVVGVAAGLACLSVSRQAVFKNSLNLWTDTFAKSPFSDTAANNLGYALLQDGQYNEALKIFEKAVNLTQGKKPNVWAGAAVTFEKLGRQNQAEDALGRAIALEAIYADPDQVVKSLLVTREQADVMREILKRMPLKKPAGGAGAP
jgi:hypothetical protein